MDRRQKSTLRGQHIRIADELILDEDFYAALRRDKIFTHGMIDIIKAVPKPRDQVYKMLELLEKRGPKAFGNFINILKENYYWLAEVLEEEYNKRLHQDQKGHTTQSYEQLGASIYNRESHREYNHRNLGVQPERNLRAVSTPPSKLRNPSPIQATMSASLMDKDNQQFFYDPDQPKIPQDIFDATDNLTIAVTTSNNDVYEKPKKYKDACMSPISIFESSRKMVHTTTSPINEHNVDVTDSALPQSPNQTEAMPNTTHIARKQSNEADSAYSMTTDDAESQMTDITHVSSSGFPVDETRDDIDGPKDLDTESAINDDGFPSSETYYECVRRGSSCMPPEGFHNEDDEHEETGTEMSEDHIHYIPYEETELYQENQEAMKAMYIKLAEAASDNADTNEVLEDEINWEVLNDAADRLIGRLQNSDDMKMIRRCYSLFPEKERRHALNMCIQSLQDGKKEAETQLRNKQKEIEEMVHDLWKHQQDISNIKRLRKSVCDLETDKQNMKMSLENLEKDFEVKMKLLDDKDFRIQELESKLRENEPRRAGNIQRRGSQNTRPRAVPTQQSPRRQGSQYPLDAPRLSVIQSAYGNQSPRPQNVAGRRPTNPRR